MLKTIFLALVLFAMHTMEEHEDHPEDREPETMSYVLRCRGAGAV